MLRAMLSNSAVHPVASGPTQQLMANASSNNIDHPPQLAAKDVNPAASGGAMNAKLITVVAPRDISKPTAPPVTGNVYRAEASVAPEAAAEEYPDYDSECPICMETFEEPLRLPCSHILPGLPQGPPVPNLPDVPRGPARRVQGERRQPRGRRRPPAARGRASDDHRRHGRRREGLPGLRQLDRKNRRGSPGDVWLRGQARRRNPRQGPRGRRLRPLLGLPQRKCD